MDTNWIESEMRKLSTSFLTFANQLKAKADEQKTKDTPKLKTTKVQVAYPALFREGYDMVTYETATPTPEIINNLTEKAMKNVLSYFHQNGKLKENNIPLTVLSIFDGDQVVHRQPVDLRATWGLTPESKSKFQEATKVLFGNGGKENNES